ncbi:MAG: PilN domain-containing protein [Rubrivivax sp.]|nr:PilN domain-containing protein [Rubrivivax sp.]MDP3082983.1 PilN domain-containing protein [Rubrivivax sp.]
MAQQINLFSPILLTPKRHFSALAMAQALGVFALALAALCVWSALHTSALEADLASTTRANQADKQRLDAALAAQPQRASSSAALEQELAALERELAEQQKRFDSLSRGLVRDGRSPTALLGLVARSLPAPAWLTEVAIINERIELAGMTLQPDALQAWLTQLSAHPLLAGQRLGALKVERSTAAAPSGADAWSFQIVSAAAPASGAAR